MEKVKIKDREFNFIKDFKDNEKLRRSFNKLTQSTFGFDFEQWYQEGYWWDGYVPYSLCDGENIIASVSISIIDFNVLGEKKKYVQIGTVMTDKNYRNKGLSRYLMERVISEWDNNCDMIYLFANDSVLDFYPKFGFVQVSEYQYSKGVRSNNLLIEAQKLDMSLKDNRNLVKETVENSIPVSRLSMLKNPGLVMFYCALGMNDNVYYLREQDSITIAEFKGDTLYLYDVFTKAEIDLEDIIKSLSNKDVKKVVLGFVPSSLKGYDMNLLKEENTTLFIMKDKADLFKKGKLMFPVLSHA